MKSEPPPACRRFEGVIETKHQPVANPTESQNSSREAGQERGGTAQVGLSRSVASFVECGADEDEKDTVGKSDVSPGTGPETDMELGPRKKDKGGCCECVIA